MYTSLITLTEDGKSTDYQLFDEYYNAIMNASSASARSAEDGMFMSPTEFGFYQGKDREILSYTGPTLRHSNK